MPMLSIIIYTNTMLCNAKNLIFLTFSDLILMFLIASDICSNNSDFAVICDIHFLRLKEAQDVIAVQ